MGHLIMRPDDIMLSEITSHQRQHEDFTSYVKYSVKLMETESGMVVVKAGRREIEGIV